MSDEVGQHLHRRRSSLAKTRRGRRPEAGAGMCGAAAGAAAVRLAEREQEVEEGSGGSVRECLVGWLASHLSRAATMRGGGSRPVRQHACVRVRTRGGRRLECWGFWHMTFDDSCRYKRNGRTTVKVGLNILFMKM